MLYVFLFGAIIIFLISTEIIFKIFYWIWYAVMTIYVGSKNYIQKRIEEHGLYDANGNATAKYWQSLSAGNTKAASKRRHHEKCKRIIQKYLKK